ncbi:MAG: tryptophan-rich sensory protein [Candidatus Cloacimonetes bacterium]|jgi:benzodiazapine receptor|nr:tryptophan-rich sensory protein [Candidatus Cloacimonadota bacterium]
MKQVVALVVSFLVSFAAAAIGGLATRSAPEFYTTLVRPSWAPPASLFGPMWTVLYALMAVAAWLVWRQRATKDVRGPLVLFGVQLALNALWSWLFFAWRMGLLAEIEIVVLLVLIAFTVVAFWKVTPLAGMLLLPYLAWVGYATALTFALVGANPDVLR